MKKRADLGIILYLYRKEHGIKQKDMAKKIGIQPSMMSFIERGRIKPSEKIVEKLRKEYGIRGLKIFVGNPTMREEFEIAFKALKKAKADMCEIAFKPEYVKTAVENINNAISKIEEF